MMVRRSEISSALLATVLIGCGTSPSGATEASASATTMADTGAPMSSTGATGAVSGGAAELPRGPLRAGVAVGYLTGPVGASMAGYGGRTVTNETAWNELLNGASGFYGYGTIKAIALEVEGEVLVLVKIPTMSSEHSLTEGAIAKLKTEHDVDLTGRLITAATHSHHNIARYWRLPKQLGFVGSDSPDEEIIDRMTTQIAAVVARAILDLGPAQWGVAWQDDWDPEGLVYRDRRGENNPTYAKDPRLTLFAVQRPEGTPMAVIMNFGMHGTVFDSPNELFTEDAPGGVEMKFEEAFFAAKGAPIFGMFMQSGGGDASPAGDQLDHHEPARIELVGHAAAPRVLDLYEKIEWRDEATLGVRSRRIDLTYKGIGYEAYPEFTGAGGTPYLWGGWQCKGQEGDVDDANPATSMAGHPKNCMPVESLLKSFGASIPNGEVHQTYLSVASLDDFFFITLPGEPTASVIEHTRGELAAREVRGMVFGYSQDHYLYLTQPDDWLQGGYEAEMSLWGPLFAQYLVGRQMELVDALKAGEGAPVWSEESPNLSVGTSFTPRAIEASAEPPALTLAAPAEIGRGETLRLGWTGGDPSLGEPHVVVQVDAGAGFVDVPSPSGWAGAALDNSRYHMLTHYAPTPEPKGEILPIRSHGWYVDWQVPADMPSGTYRLVVEGRARVGQTTSDYRLESGPFMVTISKGLTVSARLSGGTLTLDMTLAPPAYETFKGWPISGYRLLDPEAGAADPIRVRAPLTLAFFKDGAQVGATYEVAFTPGQGHMFDFAATGLVAEGLSVQVHLRDDRVAMPIEAPIEVI